RFLPSKSYGVEAPILLGSGCVAWIACLAALFRLCFFPRLTIWVTSLGFCAAELLPPHPRFYSMFSGVTNWSTSAQPSRIRSRVHNSGITDVQSPVHIETLQWFTLLNAAYARFIAPPEKILLRQRSNFEIE